jgi:DNA-binding NarL/FixJ family response regulator
MTADVIRVVLADDHGVVRAGLRSLLSVARDIEVIGEATNGREAVDLAERLKPDVVILDLSMPEVDGTAALKEIAAKKLRCRVIVLTMHDQEDYLATVIEAGAAAFMAKTDASRDLADTIRAVAHGDAPPHARVSNARKMDAERNHAETERERFDRLTHREQEVVRLVGLGYSAPEIGHRLSISPKTVDTYKQRIQEKLQLSHRSQYVRFAYDLGLLEPVDA